VHVDARRSRSEILEDLRSLGFSLWFDQETVVHVAIPNQFDTLPRIVRLLTELHAATTSTRGP
jgi:hypothetical protein